MRPADAGERERLGELFAELCRIPSPSGREERVARWVTDELAALRLSVLADDEGNLRTRLLGPTGSRTVLLCAHLDTVPHAGVIRPVCDDGVWVNAEPDAILGADNKSAVAALLVLARRFAAERPPVGIELLFTVGEEEALRGAKAFDPGWLDAEWGYVFDHASPVGEIVTASPTYYKLEAEFRGASAHAGIRPEAGRSAIMAAARALAAMRVGRLDAETTANAGLISGGTGQNVVPERCRVTLEARSLDAGRAEDVVSELVDHLQDGAGAAECDVDVEVECLFHGYRQKPTDPAVQAAERALRTRGYAPTLIATGGGSDANALVAAGLPCVNVANGTERNHQPDERVSVAALEGSLDVALQLVEECAA